MDRSTRINLNTVVARSDGQVSCDLDGEVVLMSVEKGEYYRIDDIGSRIWAMIDPPQSVSALCDRLVSEYDVERRECEEDVLSFLRKLHKDDMIRVEIHAQAG